MSTTRPILARAAMAAAVLGWLAGSAAAEEVAETASSEELADLSGGQSVVSTEIQNQQMLNATNSGNSVNAGSVVSGAISLDGQALQGYSGVGNFVMNTGNNNNLQGSIAINIVLP